MGLDRADEPVLLEVAGAELEDQRAHLGERLALELAQLGELGPRRIGVAVEEHLHRARHERHREQRLGHRVVQLAGQMRALLAGGELAGLLAQAALEPVAVGHVAGRAVRPREAAVLDHADAVDLDEDLVAVGMEEGQARAVHRRGMAAEPLEPDLGLAPRRRGEDVPVGPPDQLGPAASRGSISAASLTNTSWPSASVTQTRSGDDETR